MCVSWMEGGKQIVKALEEENRYSVNSIGRGKQIVKALEEENRLSIALGEENRYSVNSIGTGKWIVSSIGRGKQMVSSMLCFLCFSFADDNSVLCERKTFLFTLIGSVIKGRNISLKISKKRCVFKSLSVKELRKNSDSERSLAFGSQCPKRKGREQRENKGLLRVGD